MTILFEPLDSDYHKRSVLYHATRLSMLHDRMLMRFDKVDEAADKVEAAAAVLVDITHGSALDAFQNSVLRISDGNGSDPRPLICEEWPQAFGG